LTKVSWSSLSYQSLVCAFIEVCKSVLFAHHIIQHALINNTMVHPKLLNRLCCLMGLHIHWWCCMYEVKIFIS